VQPVDARGNYRENGHPAQDFQNVCSFIIRQNVALIFAFSLMCLLLSGIRSSAY
jgi:hypothetical protein